MKRFSTIVDIVFKVIIFDILISIRNHNWDVLTLLQFKLASLMKVPLDSLVNGDWPHYRYRRSSLQSFNSIITRIKWNSVKIENPRFCRMHDNYSR